VLGTDTVTACFPAANPEKLKTVVFPISDP